MRTNSIHIPVLLEPILVAVKPVSGVWVDCTCGAGGYSRGLLREGASQVFGIDRDPEVCRLATVRDLLKDRRFTFFRTTFRNFDKIPKIASELPLAGVVFDLGASSLQFDQAGRGFSFLRDGPLDMRMSGRGTTAFDIVNRWSERGLEEIFRVYGEERNARPISRRIAAARAKRPIRTTRELSELIGGCGQGASGGKIHPATRCFQALRIAVNDELGELAGGLQAAERSLGLGGLLAVVSFHSLEDRIVKRFLRWRAGETVSRHFPATDRGEPAFEVVNRKAIEPKREERERNPRSRSAKLRLARRTAAPARDVDHRLLGVPFLAAGRRA